MVDRPCSLVAPRERRLGHKAHAHERNANPGSILMTQRRCARTGVVTPEAISLPRCRCITPIGRVRNISCLLMLVASAGAGCDQKQNPSMPVGTPESAGESAAPMRPDANKPKSLAKSSRETHSTMLDLPKSNGPDRRATRPDVEGLRGVIFLETLSSVTFSDKRSATDQAAKDEQFCRFTRGQRILLVIADLEMEVNNGGFIQYFGNSSGDYAPESAVALRALGLERFAEVMSEANALFPGGCPPHSREARNAVLEKIEAAKLEALDSRFFSAYGKPEEITEALDAYVWAHPDEFFRD